MMATDLFADDKRREKMNAHIEVSTNLRTCTKFTSVVMKAYKCPC